jgi:hypothetical protein
MNFDFSAYPLHDAGYSGKPMTLLDHHYANSPARNWESVGLRALATGAALESREARRATLGILAQPNRQSKPF